jgi:hypothetical protein
MYKYSLFVLLLIREAVGQWNPISKLFVPYFAVCPHTWGNATQTQNKTCREHRTQNTNAFTIGNLVQ